MARTRLNGDTIKVFVDGFPAEDLWEFELNIGTYDSDWGFESGAFYKDRVSNVQSTITGKNGTKLDFTVQGKEQIGNELHFYGPLRDLFPALFAEIDPLEWQVAYLEFSGRPSLDRFKVRRNDPMFLTDAAKAYFSGYDKGFTAGAVNERKLAQIAADGLKNPMKYQSKKGAEADEYTGILGETFKRRKGK